MDEDIELVESYLGGSDEAMERLVMKYQKPVYAFIYRMTNNIEDAKDLTQKTFLNAVKGVKGFRRESSFKTWLYRIAANTCLNDVRSRRDETVLEESFAGNQRGALSALIEEEKSRHIKDGIDKLSERQRLAVILRVYDGLSCIETAKVMGCSEGAVKAHYHNGVQRLREILKERGYEV
ncbi:MAG: RNA polymerase sigma factor [Nitrospirae bacterium]|nr:RNA polymerase sigma factor [Nitrospirota bacterium]